jgi:hypothetical protein
MVLGFFPLGLLVFWAVRLGFGKKFRGMAKQRFAGRSQSALPGI